MNALERLKYIQSLFKTSWYGIMPTHTGRPGTSTLCNKKRLFTVPPEFTEEENRSKNLQMVLQMIKLIEEEMPLSIPNG